MRKNRNMSSLIKFKKLFNSLFFSYSFSYLWISDSYRLVCLMKKGPDRSFQGNRNTWNKKSNKNKLTIYKLSIDYNEKNSTDNVNIIYIRWNKNEYIITYTPKQSMRRGTFGRGLGAGGFGAWGWVSTEKERFTVTLVLLYLHAQPTYTGQSTEQPDTHFRHLRLDAFGHQCFHSSVCRQRWLKVYKAITWNIEIQNILESKEELRRVGVNKKIIRNLCKRIVTERKNCKNKEIQSECRIEIEHRSTKNETILWISIKLKNWQIQLSTFTFICIFIQNRLCRGYSSIPEKR